MNKKILISGIILFFMLLGFLFSYNLEEEINYSNPPCWYYTNESAGEIKLFEINSSDVNLYLNEDKTRFFLLHNETKEEIPECIVENELKKK